MLVFGPLWTPQILGRGSLHTSPAWMCALVSGARHGGRGTEGGRRFLETRGVHAEG